MITTNKTQPKEQEEPKKSRVITANELEPKGFDLTPRKFPDVDKRETKKVEGPMLTTGNMEERVAQKAVEINARKPKDKPKLIIPRKRSSKRKRK